MEGTEASSVASSAQESARPACPVCGKNFSARAIAAHADRCAAQRLDEGRFSMRRDLFFHAALSSWILFLRDLSFVPVASLFCPSRIQEFASQRRPTFPFEEEENESIVAGDKSGRKRPAPKAKRRPAKKQKKSNAHHGKTKKTNTRAAEDQEEEEPLRPVQSLLEPVRDFGLRRKAKGKAVAPAGAEIWEADDGAEIVQLHYAPAVVCRVSPQHNSINVSNRRFPRR